MKYEFELDEFEIEEFMKNYTFEEQIQKDYEEAEIIEDYKSFAWYDVDMY